ncbi:MAG: GntR family transcriptional regulator, partial [Planctomycetota bacterium]
MRIEVDRTSPLPLRDQISDALRRDIDRGTLAAGTRLPSSRDLARAVGVNRTTIVESYRALVAEGRLEAGVGRGTFVRGTAPLPGPSSERKAPFSW